MLADIDGLRETGFYHRRPGNRKQMVESRELALETGALQWKTRSWRYYWIPTPGALRHTGRA
jgi:hypothetical protein